MRSLPIYTLMRYSDETVAVLTNGECDSEVLGGGGDEGEDECTLR